MSELLNRQMLFTSCQAKLVQFIESKGWRCTIDDVRAVDLHDTLNLLKNINPESQDHAIKLSETISLIQSFLHSLHSRHYLKLAIDVNLFKPKKVWRDFDGSYSTQEVPIITWSFCKTTKDHAECGAFWKSLNPLCRWGGDFKSPDGRHYSIEWEGRA